MSRPAVIAPKRVFLLCALVGAILAAFVLALRWRSIVESYVTSAAIADAREKLAKRQPYGESFGDDGEAITKELAVDWNAWFLAGYLDRRLLLGKLASGTDALEALCVISTYYSSLERVVGEEIATWCELVALSSSAKELLVDTLMGDLPWFPRCPEDPPEDRIFKLILFTLLFSPPKNDPLFLGLPFSPYEEIENWSELEQRVLASISPSAWRSIVRDTSAPREKTRAGALLLLYRHPAREVFEAEARRGLVDPSQLVRLAAAGTLAMKGSAAGEDKLLEGMSHDRWEIRFWCLHAIRALGKDTPTLIVQRFSEEEDPWLLKVLIAPHVPVEESPNGIAPASEE